MAEPIKVYIHYDADVSTGSIIRVLAAFEAGICENWAAVGTWPAVYHRGAEISECTARDIAVDLTTPRPSLQGIFYSQVGSEFCPASAEVLELIYWKRQNESRMFVELRVREHIKYEDSGARERARMEEEWEAERERRGLPPRVVFEWPQEGEMDEEARQRWWDKYNDLLETASVWPQNRQCLLNIVEHLKQALPVKSVVLDPRLLDP